MCLELLLQSPLIGLPIIFFSILAHVNDVMDSQNNTLFVNQISTFSVSSVDLINDGSILKC